MAHRESFVMCALSVLLIALYFTSVFVATETYSTMSPQIRITLLGDSLLNMPVTSFGLTEKLGMLLPGRNPYFFNEGENGNTIWDIRRRLDIALSHESDYMVLFWDSDISDQTGGLFSIYSKTVLAIAAIICC